MALLRTRRNSFARTSHTLPCIAERLPSLQRSATSNVANPGFHLLHAFDTGLTRDRSHVEQRMCAGSHGRLATQTTETCSRTVIRVAAGLYQIVMPDNMLETSWKVGGEMHAEEQQRGWATPPSPG